MQTKRIPALTMLLGCSVAGIAAYKNHYSLEEMLITLLIVIVIFFILGVVVKVLFDRFIPIPKENAVSDEGEVIEKLPEESLGEGEDMSEETGEAMADETEDETEAAGG